MADIKSKSKAKSSSKNEKNVIKKEKEVRVDLKKIHPFIRGLSGAEVGYIINVLNTSLKVKGLIMSYKIPKKVFCEKVGISPSQYTDFVVGAFNYSLEHLVKLGSLQNDLERKDDMEKTISGWIDVAKDTEK